MIGLFPTPYEDELAYSVFARYFARTGYLCYASAAEDLYVNPKNKPSFEFVNRLTKDAINQIGDIEKFVMEHTVFRYYGAFIPKARREKAYHLACAMQVGELMNALPMPQNRSARYLRYCPLCAEEDRQHQGETYWHRSHNLFGVTACHRHGCKLVDSDIPLTSSASPSLIMAEAKAERIPLNTSRALPAEIQVAKYANKILESDIEPKTDMNVFLDAYLRTTAYVSPRGVKRNMEALSNEFKQYYQGVELFGFGEPWQIEKIINGHRFNPFEIALLGGFLGIRARTLVAREKPPTSQTRQAFDDNIRLLKAEGYNYHQIAEPLGISYDYAKTLAYGKKGKLKGRTITHQGGRKIDWGKLDKATMPKVTKLLTELNEMGDSKPQRVSVSKVEKLLKLKEKQLEKLPQCYALVQANTPTQEKYWARIIAWAIQKLENENMIVNITAIMRLTNIRKKNIDLTLPYLSQYIDISDKYSQLFL